MLNDVKNHSQHLLISIFCFIFAAKIIIKNTKMEKKKEINHMMCTVTLQRIKNKHCRRL